MRFPQLLLQLPHWIEPLLDHSPETFPTPQERMRLVIELARANVEHQSGGPFGAAIFDDRSNQLVAPGVNLVIPSNCSMAHAEIIAIVLAQQTVGSFDLGTEGLPGYTLVSSVEPCAMCLGAIPWSGVRRLVCGARDADARAIGFDEGCKPRNWIEAFEARGIAVERDVLRNDAAAVLQHYKDSGGCIYNAGGSSVCLDSH